MLELLVAGLCFGDYACDKALKAYYYERPRLGIASKQIKNRVVANVGESIAYTIPALAAAAAGHSYQLKLGQKWSIGKSQNDTMLLFRLDF